MEDVDMKWQGKKVLVTGGTGFVGSHLVEKLVEFGAEVVTTNLLLEPKSYFVTQKLDEQVAVADVDITDFEALHDLITKTEPEYIFHLAAQALVDVAYYNPRRTLDSNIMGTVNVLESARLYPRIKGIVVASSDKAYGKTNQKKYMEETPLQGDHPYEVSKSAADLICYSYFKTYGVPVTVSRFGNIYGEGDLNTSRIIPGVLLALVRGETLQIRSDGKMVRDYLYVKDVVEGYLRLAEKIEQTQGEAYNFGSNETLTVLQVVKMLESSLGKKIAYKILNQAKNEIPYQSLNYDKVKRTLSWTPKNSISVTAKRMYEWYAKV
ncbi:MAG: GDP-mannose 4,6-dehydratase [bacterium]